MYISNGDISITLSGGSENSSYEASLGGAPSNYPIIGERLFEDISEKEALEGFQDYKCIYINNNSFDATLYEAVIYTESKKDSDVFTELGFIVSNERQSITINKFNKVIGGSFKLVYIDYSGQTEVTVLWNESASILAENLQNSLRSINNLQDVLVYGNLSGDNLILEINYIENSGGRYHELIQETSNDLEIDNPEQGDGNISITRNVFGSPINNQAEEISTSFTTPFGVSFNSFNSRENAYSIGTIRPGDVIPVWIKRVAPEGTKGLEGDGINIRVEGKALPSTTEE